MPSSGKHERDRPVRIRRGRCQVETDGVWFPVTRRDYLLACCDCGLVHSVDIRLGADDRLWMRAFRLPKVTALNRRRRKRGNQ